MVGVRRLVDAPIIRPEMLPGTDGDNINGPSLIEAPDWLPHRLGRFYLYFAHHGGRYIRLAYADDLAGPWRIHLPGTLRLEQVPVCRGHIASPDVHVDHATRQIVMFFHGPLKGFKDQRTFVARSSDGTSFVAGSDIVARFYLRTVRWRRFWIGMAAQGIPYLAETLLGRYRRMRPMFAERDDDGPSIRHVALKVTDDDVLRVYYSKRRDAPERIYRSDVDLRGPVESWTAVGERLVLAPETAWEGADLPARPSQRGAARGPERALRDPAIFEWQAKDYLLYSVAGESGIGIAELVE
jgi:hypothetical protein